MVRFALPFPNMIVVCGQLSPCIRCMMILHIRITFFSVVKLGLSSCSARVGKTVFRRRNSDLQDSLVFLMSVCDNVASLPRPCALSRGPSSPRAACEVWRMSLV